MKLTTVKTLTLAALMALSLPAMAVVSASASFAASALASLDPDHDGTVDLAEAKTAASALFDKLEKDNDGTLFDDKELHGHIRKPRRGGSPTRNNDNNGVSKDEDLAYVEVLFKKADPAATARSTPKSWPPRPATRCSAC